MQIIFDYLNGKVSGQEFIAAARKDEKIADWFQKLLPPGAEIIDKPYIPYQFIDFGHCVYQTACSSHPFWKNVSVNECLNILKDRVDFREFFQNKCHFDTAGGRMNVYYFLYSLVKTQYPELTVSDRYDKELDFYLDLCGNYLEGPEVRHFLNNLIFEIYNMPGTRKEKEKIARVKLKETFHLEGKRRPYWVQEPEWPMGKKSPMKYISVKKEEEKKIYCFQDVDTGQIREIEQFY